jgi:hypothetical protein
MFIKAICISGFKNHKESTVYKFSNFSEILGKNAQGKTTIGEAIIWGLYGCDLLGDAKCDTRLMNNDSDSMFVIIDYEYEGMSNRIVRKKSKSLTLKFNDEKITEKELSKYLPNKDLFLSIFNPKVFLSLQTARQRQLLLKILPKIDHNDIIKKYKCEDISELLLEYPNINDGIKKISSQKNSKEDLLTSKNGEINILQNLIIETMNNIEVKDEFTADDENNLQELQYKVVSNNSNSIEIISTDNLKYRISEIGYLISDELNKTYKSSNAEYIQELKISLATLSGEYNIVTDNYNKFNTLDSVCSMCGQPITEEHRNKELILLTEKLDNLKSEIDSIKDSIGLLESLDENNLNSFNDSKAKVLEKLEADRTSLNTELDSIEESNKLMKELSLRKDNSDIEIQINNLKQKQTDYLNYKSQLNTQKFNLENYKNKIKRIKDEITNITEDMNKLEIQLFKLKNYSSIYVQYISEILSSWLDRVSLNLFTVSDLTGEIKDTFEIKYDNKPLRLISNSEFVKVGLEFSNMFNQTLNINLPVFIDDAEAILNMPKLPTQMIVAKVKDCDLIINSSERDIISNNIEEVINEFTAAEQLAFN